MDWSGLFLYIEMGSFAHGNALSISLVHATFGVHHGIQSPVAREDGNLIPLNSVSASRRLPFLGPPPASARTPRLACTTMIAQCPIIDLVEVPALPAAVPGLTAEKEPGHRVCLLVFNKLLKKFCKVSLCVCLQSCRTRGAARAHITLDLGWRGLNRQQRGA
jgi:hypothetical protein